MTKCTSCGRNLEVDAPEGLCPVCLLSVSALCDTPTTTAFTPPSLVELAGLFPQLEILRMVGKGGMGAVYQARQKSLDRVVALKILPGNRDPGFVERFAREARALAKLNHPGIVAIYEFGEAGGFLFFIMEFVDGLNLRQVERAGKLTPGEGLNIVPQICEALQYAHDEGIVHRDIKPENILLDKKGRVKIADFGIAKIMGKTSDMSITGSQDVMGTPHYMAPEQIEKPTEVDHRADIYSLGVVFYELLTGELPLGRFAPPSRKVQIDVRLDDVVLRALEKEPERRYQHISQVKTDVETISQSHGAPPAGTSEAHKPEKVSRLVAAIFFAVTYLGLLVFLAVSAGSLSARVATHFGGEGEANGWMSRGHYLWFVAGLPLVFAGIVMLAGWLTRILPARFVNIPRRDYWLAPERRDSLAAFLQRRTLWLACIMTGFVAGLHALTIEANRLVPPHVSMGGLMTAVLVFLMLVLVWTICLLMRLAEVDKPLGKAVPDAHGATSSPVDEALIAQARSRVQIPAIGLMITAALNLLVMVAAVVMLGIRLRISMPVRVGGDPGTAVTIQPNLLVLVLGAGLLLLSPSLLMLFGAMRMQRMANYGLAVAVSILAIIMPPGLLLGLVFGIWSLVVLSDKKVRSAFDTQRKASRNGCVMVIIAALVLLTLLVSGSIAYVFVRHFTHAVVARAYSSHDRLEQGFLPEQTASLGFLEGYTTGVTCVDLDTGAINAVNWDCTGGGTYRSWDYLLKNGCTNIAVLDDFIDPITGQGVDLFGAYFDPIGSLNVPFTMLTLTQVSNEYWTAASTATVQALLAACVPPVVTGMEALVQDSWSCTIVSNGEALPITFAFATRQGSYGLLQVTSFSNTVFRRETMVPGSINIRFKRASATMADPASSVDERHDYVRAYLLLSSIKAFEQRSFDRDPSREELVRRLDAFMACMREYGALMADTEFVLDPRFLSLYADLRSNIVAGTMRTDAPPPPEDQERYNVLRKFGESLEDGLLPHLAGRAIQQRIQFLRDAKLSREAGQTNIHTSRP